MFINQDRKKAINKARKKIKRTKKEIYGTHCTAPKTHKKLMKLMKKFT
jgi:metal-dependent hydrolase (beta-lactamase superfamily II)